MAKAFDKPIERRTVLTAGAVTVGAMATASCGSGGGATEDAAANKSAAGAAAATGGNGVTRILTRDAVAPGENLPTGRIPSKAIIRKIDMPKNVKTLDIKFSAGYAAIALNKTVTIESILKKLAAGTDPSAIIPDPYPTGIGAAKEVSSPLSLDVEGDAYVVYVLDDNTSWQFCTLGSPFSIENIKDDSGKMKPEFYACPRRWDAKANSGVEGKVPLTGCKIAYMIALCAGRGDYVDRFNIHLELVVQNQWSKVPIYVPIILDPDIRHPGGSVG